MTGPWIKALAVLAGVTALAVPVAAGNSGLIRLDKRDELFGWEAVGRVDIGKDGYCTGALIAPNLVLTAAHCVFDRANRRVDPATIVFRAGLRDGKALAERKVGRFAVVEKYDPAAPNQASKIRRDAALLELSDPIPTSIADPFALHDGQGKGQRVSVVSYGRGRDAALSWQRDCGVLEQWDGLLAFDCNVTFGSSGAPVFLKYGNRARILSLISSGGSADDGTISFGMQLPTVVSGLKRTLRAMPAVQTNSAGFRRVKVGQGGGATGAKFAKP